MVNVVSHAAALIGRRRYRLRLRYAPRLYASLHVTCFAIRVRRAGNVDGPSDVWRQSPKRIMSTLTMSRGSDSHMEKKLAPVDPALAIPIRLTNFSIQEILKPRFGIVATQRGVKRAELERDTEPHLSAFTAKVRRLSSEQDTDLPCFIGKSSKKDVIGDVQKRYSESSDSDSTHSNGLVWPAWVYCTRYSDRPSAGE